MFGRVSRVVRPLVVGGTAAAIVAGATTGSVVRADAERVDPSRSLKTVLDDLNASPRDRSVVMSAVFPRTMSLLKEDAEFAGNFDGTEAGFSKAISDAKSSIEVRALGVHLTAADILDTLSRNFKELRLDLCDSEMPRSHVLLLLMLLNFATVPGYDLLLSSPSWLAFAFAAIILQQAGSQVIRITNDSRKPSEKSRSLFLEVSDVRFRAFYAADHMNSQSVDIIIGTVDERVLPWITAAIGALIVVAAKFVKK